VEIIETIVLFTALTSLIVTSFAVAANVASYQAVTAESVYARNIMTQLAYGIQGIAEGREASTPIQFSYRLGVFTYNDQLTLTIVLTDPQGETNTTAYSNDHFACLEYASPHVMYGPTPVSDKGTMVAGAYTSILGDAVIAHHFSANGTTYVIVKTQPVISSHVNADGTVDVQILIVELVRTSPLLTHQGYLVSTYTSTNFAQYSYLSGPVTVSVTYAGHTKLLTVGIPGRAVNVFEKTVQVTIS
jgi:hypothetical protein